MKAFAYLRVSTDRQEVVAQRAQAAAYAAYHRYELLDLADEIDVSGSVPFAERPVGAELLRRLAECDAVIVTKVDRAFRDTVDAILTVALLQKAGKSVHFLDMGLDTTTPAGELCLTVMAAFAAFERRRIGERIKEKLAAVQTQGRKIGPAPFGYRNLARMVDGRKVDGGRHEAVEDEQRMIARIRMLRSGSGGKAMSYRAIAEMFERYGVPTRRGGKWAPETVRKIVRRMV